MIPIENPIANCKSDGSDVEVLLKSNRKEQPYKNAPTTYGVSKERRRKFAEVIFIEEWNAL
jgi:hypothetical protein